jgi:hypothetical protein
MEVVKKHANLVDRIVLQEVLNSGGRVPDDSLYANVSEIIILI